jgi:hypothetical protein
MNRVKTPEWRPGTCIRQTSSGQLGVVVAPPPGERIDPDRTWVDLGKGPERIKDDDLQVVLRHVRLTIRHNPQDPEDDLRQAARLRYDLWAHSPVGVDEQNPFCETRWDAARNAYFEFPTEFPGEVRRVLREYGHEGRVTMEDLGEVGLVCPKCGFLGGYVTVCPNCEHRYIDPCPHCGHEIATDHYGRTSDDLFICPNCRRRVRFQFNPEFDNRNVSVPEPVILVEDAQV